VSSFLYLVMRTKCENALPNKPADTLNENLYTSLSTMTITTRTIAKGIPPRLHDPKPKGKPHAKKSNTKTTQGSRKRVTRDSDDDSSPEDEVSSSDDSELARRAKKKAGKRRRVEFRIPRRWRWLKTTI
jgi:outer membrane biosynthesis protein TonB